MGVGCQVAAAGLTCAVIWGAARHGAAADDELTRALRSEARHEQCIDKVRLSGHGWILTCVVYSYSYSGSRNTPAWAWINPPKTLTYTLLLVQHRLPANFDLAARSTCRLRPKPTSQTIPQQRRAPFSTSEADGDDAIVRLASYRRRDFVVDLVHCNPGRLGFTLFKSFDRDHPASSLGSLETLPLEFLTAVLLRLDLQPALRCL